MSKLDDLAAWRYFVTFAKTGTLSAAASALGVDVSNLSRAIAGLEKALGTPAHIYFKNESVSPI